jgi:hypothetical protein
MRALRAAGPPGRGMVEVLLSCGGLERCTYNITATLGPQPRAARDCPVLNLLVDRACDTHVLPEDGRLAEWMARWAPYGVFGVLFIHSRGGANGRGMCVLPWNWGQNRGWPEGHRHRMCPGERLWCRTLTRRSGAGYPLLVAFGCVGCSARRALSCRRVNT